MENPESVELETIQDQNADKKLESSSSGVLLVKSQEVVPLVAHDIDPLVAKKKKKSKSPKRVHAPVKDRKKEIIGAYLSSTDFSKLKFAQVNSPSLDKNPIKSAKLNINGSRSAAVSPKRQEEDGTADLKKKHSSPVQAKKHKKSPVAKLTKNSPYAAVTSKFIL